jgi:fibronectin-binding autotransporter adhesin
MKTGISPKVAAALALAGLSLAPAIVKAQSTWNGAGVDANWSSANWDVAPADGAALIFGSAFTSGTTLNNDLSLATIGSLTFNTTLPSAGLTITGNAITLTGGITNNNITAGRPVTIGNNIAVSGAQTWSTAVDVDAVTTLNGNLTGSGNITIGTAIASNVANLPTLRLAGNNIGYTGTISTTGTDTGIMLMSPTAQTGGLIDLNNGNRNLWLNTNTAATPYTFWTGNTTPTGGNPMAVNFRNAGTSGIFLANGDVHWNPTSSGSDYVWDAAKAGTNSEIRINGSNDVVVPQNQTPVQVPFIPTPRTLTFGNSSGSLILGGNRSFNTGGSGANPGRVAMQFALSDDGTARNFTTGVSLLTLSRAADTRGGAAVLTGNTVVSGGALSLAAMDRIFNGWLQLNGGVAILDGISWNDFTADRTAGFRASAGADSWGITGPGGGFAARGSDVTIFINSDVNATYGTVSAGAVFNRDFAIGAGARADDKTLYANARVIISQDIVLTAARSIRLHGGNRESLGNWTIDSPIHELSGAISGSFALNIGGGSTTAGGTLRLSNTANSFSALNVNPSGVSLAGGAVVIGTDDAVFGTGAITVSAGGNGEAGLLMFENQGAGQKTFTRSFTVAHGANASAGESGFGVWAGDVLSTGTVTITGSRSTLPVHVQGGQLSFGAGSAFQNDSTGGTQTYSKGGAGTLVLDGNVSYTGTNANLQWALRQGTLVTSTATNKLANGTAAFDGDNIIGNDGTTWLSSTNSITGWIPVSRTWKVTTADQSYTSAAMAFTGYTTVDVEGGRTLTLDTGANATSPSEGRGNTSSTPRWDLVKTGQGTWVFRNSDLATPAGSGPQNGAGFIRIDQGTLDITGDYGRGSLSVNGGTLLSGAFSPFTYGTGAGAFALGVTQTSLLEVTSAGGKIGISSAATGNVSRSSGFFWDQSGSSTLTLAARDALNLVFASATFPDVAAGNTLDIERDGAGAGFVQINDSAVTISGTLSGSGALRAGSAGLGALNIAGILSPETTPATLDLEAALNLGATSTFAAQLGGASPGDGSGFYDQVNVTNVTGSISLDSAATLSLSTFGGFAPTNSDIFFILTHADAGAFSDTFAGAPEGGTVNIAGGYSGTITYLADWTGTQGGSSLTGGNDVAIYNVIPEPGSAALLLGGLGLLANRRRRTR